MARIYNCATETWSRSKYGNHFLTDHFQVKEFACKDGTDEVVICPELLLKCLEPLFLAMNAKAINITSGYRTVAHSLSINGKGEFDNHHMGMAADIKVKKQDGTFYSSKEVCCALEDLGWNYGIGYMSTAVHVDTGSKCWFDETNHNATTTSWRAKFNMPKETAQTPIKASAPAASAHRGTAYTMTCSMLKVRKSASTLSKQVGQFSKGDTFYVVAHKGNWCQLENGNWMCAGKYLKKL